MTLYNSRQVDNFLFLFVVVFYLYDYVIMWFFLGAKSESKNRDIPFESGVNTVGRINLRMPIQFSLFAILFVIFDVEAFYLYLWSVNVEEVGWIGFFEIFFYYNVFNYYLVFNKKNMLKWILSHKE
ncbi:NADH dehydrogenase I chain A [Buchnera aphidicola (Cinara tujafilina)]|uniref:NADH-quinone oxidoreductase subunit n=1 Tax=Buchnera aphidicola (Cinara tujafilina) TaxID=261317 RepID=F7WZ41_9GAMM|nr:NADH-quinone oxidoreductase subunit A [Buchnera aphidicola]AEH39692.1 NADH dehydrogenase I chain A [Buchnera aphidicola (Cinara tujafilina)]